MAKHIPWFALEGGRNNSPGLTCDASGVALAGSPLLARTPSGFQPRPARELDLILKAAYEAVAFDTALLVKGLAMTAEALNAGDVERAMIGALHLRLPPLSESAADRIAKVDHLIGKYNYNPEEPRDWRGRWTSSGNAGTPPPKPDPTSPLGSVPGEHGDIVADEFLTPVAYNGYTHDQVVRDYAATLRSKGQLVVTEVSLIMADGSAGARLDILARDPVTGLIYGVEVKTGDRPGFTPGQLVVYPHFMMGESVMATDAKVAAIGLVPNLPLPPIPIYLMRQRGLFSDPEFTELDPAKMSRYYRGH